MLILFNFMIQKFSDSPESDLEVCQVIVLMTHVEYNHPFPLMHIYKSSCLWYSWIVEKVKQKNVLIYKG